MNLPLDHGNGTYASPENVEIPHLDLLSWTFGNTSYDPDKPIFIDCTFPERHISYNQAKTIVRKLIAGFKANGLHTGDTVCLHSSNNIYYALVFLAVTGSGGRFIGSNPNYTATEMSHLFLTSEAKFVIVEEDHLKCVQEAWIELGLNLDNIFLFNTFSPPRSGMFRDWNVLFEYGELDWMSFEDEKMAKTTIACLMSTSGTTGLPKAAQFSHYAKIAESIVLHEDRKPYDAVLLMCLPQCHAFNFPISTILPLREGHKIYIMKRYNPEAFLAAIKAYRPTETTMVNPIVFKLLEICKNDRESLRSLRFISTGGVRLSLPVQNRLREILHPSAIVRQIYGMTEIGWATALKYPEQDYTGTVGRLLPNYKARVVDEAGNNILENGVEGQLLLSSPTITIGYLNNQSATASTIFEGWLHTGDIAYIVAGKWYIIDRKKELIKVRGWQVSPTEIEQCLMAHPSILDVAVIGVDLNDDRGELPRAYVVVDRLATITEQDIKDFLKDKLVYYKWLAGGVKMVESLPRNSVGKVLKGDLREQAKAEILRTHVERLALKHKSEIIGDDNSSSERSQTLAMEASDSDIPGEHVTEKFSDSKYANTEDITHTMVHTELNTLSNETSGPIFSSILNSDASKTPDPHTK